jgi:predicted ATPase
MDSMSQRSIESYEKTLMEHTANAPIFFDRSFLDVLCYGALEGIPNDQEMKTFAEINRHNSNVFIFPPWQEIYQTDAQRKQDWNEAVFAYNKMIQTYRGYQYDLVEVPKTPVKERADFVLDFIKNN